MSSLENTFFGFKFDTLQKSSSDDGDQIIVNFKGSATTDKIKIKCNGKMTLTLQTEENEWSVLTSITISDSTTSATITHTAQVKITNAENATAEELILAVFKDFSQSSILFTLVGTELKSVLSNSVHKSYRENGDLVLSVYVYPRKSTSQPGGFFPSGAQF